jgi:hypothetical protein
MSPQLVKRQKRPHSRPKMEHQVCLEKFSDIQTVPKAKFIDLKEKAKACQMYARLY